MTAFDQYSISRRNFVLLAGSVASASALAACGESSSDAAGDGETAKYGDGDVGILNYLLIVENLQAAFYSEIAKSNRFTAKAREALAKFGEEEKDHIASLTKEVEKLGGEPIAPTKAEFSMKTDAETLETGSELENVGAAAYLGQLGNIESDAVLKTALSIHSVEGRHAASINELLEKPVTPDGAFAKPLPVAKVLESLPGLESEQTEKKSA